MTTMAADAASTTAAATTTTTTTTTSSSSNPTRPDMDREKEENVWLVEPPTPFGVLTASGLDHIVHHKYQAGTYTALDNLLNPLWQYCTDHWLPLWLAPNAVTALGGTCSLASYIVTAHYAFDLWQPPHSTERLIPDWVLIFNGICLLLYYTLDCMDGKQARRTQSSSPLGQLFDHGVDCLANLSHLSLMQAIVGWTPRQYGLVQSSLQLGFFQAQLEEYYTGTLPHAAGNVGTTEILYGMGVWSILTGLLDHLGLVRRQELYTGTVSWIQSFPLQSIPGITWLLQQPPSAPLSVKDILFIVWMCGFGVLTVLSWIRLIRAQPLRSKESSSPWSLWKRTINALGKLSSPLILCALMIHVSAATTKNSTATNMGGIRYASLAIGLCFCMITIKLVVLGMARMAYASLQWADLMPLLLVWAVTTTSSSTPLPLVSPDLAYPLATAGYLVRLVWWTKLAVDPLCRKMQIQLFQIPYQKKKKNE